MIDEARHELKRADHLIFVSLKYTRTMDVVESTVKRLIGSIEMAIDALFQWLLKKKKIKEIPSTYKNKIEVARDNFKKDETILELLKFYSFLMRVDRADHQRKSEFRKGVAMIANDEQGDLIDEINIDKLKDYYLKTLDFIDYVEEYLSKKR
ncbi:MAG: hypothetical protein CMH62_03355 [Nanoarchaeota archaeon]|nr:hypothetical protein [Nanoarchaeota archaeon]|tara:strand:- start:862 stop:1317 length:456 start_codon:yes stop_codon:yes gene_type:complete